RLPGPFAFADLGDNSRTVFARVREIVNQPGKETLAHFVDRLFAHVDSVDCRRFVLDLRGNGGGNNYLNPPLVHALIRRPALDRAPRPGAGRDRVVSPSARRARGGSQYALGKPRAARGQASEDRLVRGVRVGPRATAAR